MNVNESAIKPRTRTNWSAQDRAAWLELFSKSGQSAAEFCRANDFPQATLSFWLRQTQTPEVTEGEMVEVALPESIASAEACVRVQLPSGMSLEVPAGMDTDWFGRLLQALVTAKV